MTLRAGTQLRRQALGTDLVGGVALEPQLHGAQYNVMADRIEAGSYIAAAAMTHGARAPFFTTDATSTTLTTPGTCNPTQHVMMAAGHVSCRCKTQKKRTFRIPR